MAQAFPASEGHLQGHATSTLPLSPKWDGGGWGRHDAGIQQVLEQQLGFGVEQAPA